MKHSLFTLGALAASALAAPLADATVQFSVVSEYGSIAGVDDYGILQFALVLEHIEAAFYKGALAKFSASDFPSSDTYKNVQRLSRDETTHVTALTAALKSLRQDAPLPCNYTFLYKTPAEFLGLAAVIEGVGVGAYAGAAASMKNPNILLTAASILPIEARHAAILRAFSGTSPFASPFDIPLDFNQAYTLAAQFIVPGSCPRYNTRLGLTAFKPLTLVQKANTPPVTPGATILLKADLTATQPPPPRRAISNRDLFARHVHDHDHEHSPRDTVACRDAQDSQTAEDADARSRSYYAAFLTPNGALTAPMRRNGDTFAVEVPAAVPGGQTYILVSTSKTELKDKNTMAGLAIIEIAEGALGS